MMIEICVSPSEKRAREHLAKAPTWSQYAAELQKFLHTAMKACGLRVFEVSELLVDEPLRDPYRSLRNGSKISPDEVVDLVERMVSGDGPYCRLIAPGGFYIQSGWDGAVHLSMDSTIADGMAGSIGAQLSIDRRPVQEDLAEKECVIEKVADETFWTLARELADGLLLLEERWANGAYGSTWFRVTTENVDEVAQAMQPRSRLCLAVNPDLRMEGELLDDAFTAFAAPLSPGYLVFRHYPGGADSFTEITELGLSLMLPDAALVGRCAVVPDSDGVVRAEWECPG